MVDQPDDRCLVPLDNIGDLDVSEDEEDVSRSIANARGVCGVGTRGDPYNDGAESFPAILFAASITDLQKLFENCPAQLSVGGSLLMLGGPGNTRV